MTQTRVRLAITLFAGAILTMIWMAVCPKYKLSGSVGSYETVSNFSERGGHHIEDFEHTDIAMFFGGEIVIWSVLAGVYLLIPQLSSLKAGALYKAIKQEIKAEST